MSQHAMGNASAALSARLPSVSSGPSVVLLQPPGACRAFTRSGSSYPPLGLCQLAATVGEEDVLVLDADGLKWDQAQTLTELKRLRPRLVGMTVNSYTLELVERYAAQLTAHQIPVLVGGPHASLAPVDVFHRCPSVTYVARGEGEVIFPELVERVRRAESLLGLPGLCARRDGASLHLAAEILQVQDFTTLPFPRLAGLPVAAELLCALGLECLRGVAPTAVRVHELGAEAAYGILLGMASNGGDYNTAWSGAYGRLAAWRSLGGLCGAAPGAAATMELPAIEQAARRCRWSFFSAPGPWFDEVVSDFAVVALRPDEESLAVLAATDSD